MEIRTAKPLQNQNKALLALIALRGGLTIQMLLCGKSPGAAGGGIQNTRRLVSGLQVDDMCGSLVKFCL